MTDAPKRRRFQFSLKGIFLLLTVIACVSAYIGYKLPSWRHDQRMRKVGALISDNGGYWEVGEAIDMGHATANQLDTVLSELSTIDNQTRMSFFDSQFGDAHVKHLLCHRGLKGLNLDRTPITDAGLKELTAIESLEDLSLEDVGITDAGIEHLTKLKRLEWLILDGDAVTDKGVEYLIKMPALKYVRFKGTKVTQQGIAKLKRAKPDCEINVYYGTPHKYEHHPDPPPS